MSDTTFTPVGNGLVVVRRGKQGLLLLNSTARLIWEMLSQGCSRSEVAEAISLRFGVDLQTVHEDIELLTESWRWAIWPGTDNNSDADRITDGTELGVPAQILDCVVHNRSFRFLISDPAVEEELCARFAPHAVSTLEVPQHVFQLGRDREGFIVRSEHGVHRGTEVTEARIGVIQEVVSACFPEKRFIAALHAGAVYRDGVCLLLSAPTQGGKSTLIAALSGSGYSVLSDDLVFLDDQTLEITGIPLGIMLRSGSWKVLEPILPHLKEMSSRPRSGESVRYLHPDQGRIPEALKPSALVFLEFSPHASLQLNTVDPFEALVRLNETRSWLDTESPYVQRFLSWLDAVPRWRMRYGNLQEALSGLQQLRSEPARLNLD